MGIWGIWSVFVIVCAALWLLSLFVHFGSVAAALTERAALRRRPARQDQPPVSILVPVKDTAPQIAAAFESIYAQTYPAFEVLVSAAEEGAPALAVARRVAAEFPHVTSRFIVEDIRAAVSPKTDNLAAALARAGHDLIVVKDANVHLAEGQIAELVRHLTPGIGLVCAVPVAVAPGNLAAEIECTMLNGRGARLLLTASALQKGIGIGALMLFDHREFARAGGIAAIAYAIGEDHALSKALARIGLGTVFSAGDARQIAGRRTFREVWTRQLRWMVIRRLEEPFAFGAEFFIGLPFSMLVGVMALCAWGASWWAAAGATLAVWLAGEALFVIASGWTWTWRTAIATICREIMIVGLAFQAVLTRRIQWGGRSLEVRARPVGPRG